MQETSEPYQALLRDPGHRKEHRAVIAGAEYHRADIVSLRTDGGIFPEPDIGRCAARQVELTLRRPAGEIPRRAEIRLYTRLAAGEQASEWLPKGVFFISARQLDKRTGNLTLHGYDAMRKAGAVWLNEADAHENWPMSQRAAVENIAGKMGVTIDRRTALSEEFPVEYPVDGAGDLTMTDVLEAVALANAGNWVMSDRGELLLLRYGDLPPETSYLVEEHGRPITFGGVRILVG